MNPKPSFVASFVAQAFESFAKLWRFQQRHRAMDQGSYFVHARVDARVPTRCLG